MFNINPLSYKFLVPPFVSENEFLKLVDLRIFPTLDGLYPAFYYAIGLSMIRFLLHYLVIKVFFIKLMFKFLLRYFIFFLNIWFSSLLLS